MNEAVSRSGETEYFSDDNVVITNSRALFQGKMYPLANVTSVEISEIPGSHIPKWLGVVIAVSAVVVLVWVSDESWLFRYFMYVMVGFMGLIGVAASFGLGGTNARWVLKIVSASGEANALVSEDRGYIEKIVAAINRAIIHRG